MAPTWPSIIPLGAHDVGPGLGLGQRPPGRSSSRVASLSTSPSASSTPQWPWSVYSSRHRSAMRTIWSPRSSRRSRSATCTMPSGSQAPEPVASLVAGTPNRMTAGTPRPASSATSLRSDSRVCCTWPGQRGDGLGLVDALADEQRGHQVVDRQAASRPPSGAGSGCGAGGGGDARESSPGHSRVERCGSRIARRTTPGGRPGQSTRPGDGVLGGLDRHAPDRAAGPWRR